MEYFNHDLALGQPAVALNATMQKLNFAAME